MHIGYYSVVSVLMRITPVVSERRLWHAIHLLETLSHFRTQPRSLCTEIIRLFTQVVMDTSAGRSGASKVDIQGIIEDWAKDYFRRKASKKEKKLLDQEQIQLEIDWRRVKFVHDEAVYEPEPPAPGNGKPTQNVLFNTTFTNKTNGPQTYTFRTERTTRSSCTVAVEQGYSQVNYDQSNVAMQRLLTFSAWLIEHRSSRTEQQVST